MKKFRYQIGILFAICVLFSIEAFAQGGNTISGHVFNSERFPLKDIEVELLDDFGRTLNRGRTNNGGRYFFSRMPAGKYRVKISPFGTNYKGQEARIEIQNITRVDASGVSVVGAFMNAQRDFYLKPEKGKISGKADTVFAQAVPDEAKALYDEGTNLINNNKKTEGFKKLIAAIEKFPDYYMAIERLGVEYVAAKHFKAASILMQRAVQIYPKSYKGWYGLAYSYYSLNLNKEALGPAKQAATIVPNSVDALLLTGTLLRGAKKFKDSEKYLTKAKSLSKNSKNPQVHWQLALLYGKNLKRYKEAAEELETYLKLLPKDKDPSEIKSLIAEFRKKSTNT